jgi:hypothetical protein
MHGKTIILVVRRMRMRRMRMRMRIKMTSNWKKE